VLRGNNIVYDHINYHFCCKLPATVNGVLLYSRDPHNYQKIDCQLTMSLFLATVLRHATLVGCCRVSWLKLLVTLTLVYVK